MVVEADWASREESWEEKARDVDDGISFFALWKPELGRGAPYKDCLDAIFETHTDPLVERMGRGKLGSHWE